MQKSLSYREFEVNKDGDGEGMQLSNKVYIKGMDTEFEQEWPNSKEKELTWLFWTKFNVLDFSTCFFYLLRA